jgi:hypothetical protein
MNSRRLIGPCLTPKTPPYHTVEKCGLVHHSKMGRPRQFRVKRAIHDAPITSGLLKSANRRLMDYSNVRETSTSYTARSTRLSISMRSVPKSIGLVRSASALSRAPGRRQCLRVSRHQYRAAARCSGGMEPAVRSAWVEPTIIARNLQSTAVAAPPRSGCRAAKAACLPPRQVRQERDFWMRRQRRRNHRQRHRTPAETKRGRNR